MGSIHECGEYIHECIVDMGLKETDYLYLVGVTKQELRTSICYGLQKQSCTQLPYRKGGAVHNYLVEKALGCEMILASNTSQRQVCPLKFELISYPFFVLEVLKLNYVISLTLSCLLSLSHTLTHKSFLSLSCLVHRMASVTQFTAEQAMRLLDFSGKVDMTLLDAVVNCFYNTVGPQVSQAVGVADWVSWYE